MDAETRQIAETNLLETIGLPLIAVVERNGEWVVIQHMRDGVAPQTGYPTARLAMSRMLQLMRIGPVAPQTHPETAGIQVAS